MWGKIEGVGNTVLIMRKWQLAIFSGLLFGFSLWHIGIGFISLFAFVPYFALLKRCKNGETFWYGLLWGVTFTIVSLHWIAVVKVIAFLGLMIALPLYFAVFSVFCKIIYKRFSNIFIWIFPIIWIGFEYFLTLGPLNFPWFNIGYSFADYYHFSQFADVFGIYGLSLLILIINALIFILATSVGRLTERHREHRGIISIRFPFSQAADRYVRIKALVFIMIIIVLWFGYGIYRVNSIKLRDTDFKIAIIQLNIPQEEKWKPENLKPTVKKYKEFTKRCVDDSTDLVIFPETAIPDYITHSFLGNDIANFAKMNKIDIITGFPNYERNKELKYYNSASLITKQGEFQGIYNKIKLVPFGERIPLLNTFPILRNLQFGQANFEQGRDYRLFISGGYKFPALICFEGVFPELVREFVARGADFIVNITNDAWYKRTIGPYQHFADTKLRAIENRVSFFRAANTGISYIANPKGKIYKIAGLYENRENGKILKGNLYLTNDTSIFTKGGHLLAVIFFYLTIILLLYSSAWNLIMTYL